MPAGHLATQPAEGVIRVRGLEAGFGERLVLQGIDLDLYRGEILGIVGASGTGKSVLARAILGLVPKQAGTIELFGKNIDELSVEERRALEQRLGVLFQFGALISSLSVKEARRAGKISWLRRLPQKQSGRKGTTFPPALRT